MIEALLKNKNWTPKIVDKFLKELQNYSDDDKCVITEQVAKELMNRGGNQNIASAEVILIYATQHYFSVSDSQLKADVYYRLGELYEKHKDNFIRAYTYYEKYTLNNKKNGGTHSLLVRALILRDDFTYSEELEKELRMSLGEADLGLRNDRIYENLGRYIVAQHEGNDEECQKIMKRLWGIVKTDELVFPDLVFIKDSVPDSIRVPYKVVKFIKSNQL